MAPNNIDMQRGLTLIEVVLYVALIALISSMVIGAVLGLLSAYERRQDQQTLERQAGIAMQAMRRDIRNAERVSNINNGEDAARLELSMLSDAESPTIYEVSSEQLLVSDGDGSDIALTNDQVRVTDIIFKHRAPSIEHDTIRIELTLMAPKRGVTLGEPYQKTFIGSAHVRNNY